MDYQVIRSGRKTLCIQLTASGDVVVRAPRRCSRAYIDGFVAEHQDWIDIHRAKLLERSALRDGFFLREGDAITLCGEIFTVHLVEGLKPRLFRGQMILPSGDMSRVRSDILHLAKYYGLPRLKQRLDLWAERMEIDYREMKMSSARTRWGSCSRDGVIRVSVYLVFAPERAIDYVLVHELAHRRHFDHSRAFWTLVEAAMPDYRQQRQFLRSFQQEPLLLSLAAKDA